MQENKFTIDRIIKGGIDIGLKNSVAIMVNGILWLLTIWIPFVNVGATIGFTVGIVVRASKGETIGMTEVFNPRYRKYIGEYFLTYSLMFIGVLAGLIFMVGPGILIAVSWSQALPLVVDQAKNPMEALLLSNKLTYGKKRTIFLANLVNLVAIALLIAIFQMIPVVGALLIAALFIPQILLTIGMNAYIYRSLCSNA